jgi:carbon storage regulator CsrA
VGELFADSKITVQITEIKGNKAKIGFDAPEQILILRDDISGTEKVKTETDKKLSLKFWWNEVFFLSSMTIAMIVFSTIEYTTFWGLILSLAIMLFSTAYYAVTFFSGNKQVEKIYFYLCMMPFLLLYFALIYKSFGLIPPGSDVISNDITWLDACYFSLVTWTTLGYGDFRPGDDTVKLFVMVEVLIGYVYMAVLVGKLLLMGARIKISDR